MASADSPEHMDTIDALLAETRTFPPSEDIRRDALVTGTDLYDEAAVDDEGFWAKQAAEMLDWTEEWTPSSTGKCRSPSGSSVAGSTSRRTASTATLPPATATVSPSSGRGSPATPAR